MDTRPLARHAVVCGCQRSLDRQSPIALSGQATTAWSAEQVYHAYYRRVRSLALRLLGNDPDAEDVAQEVLLQVVRKLHTFRGESALSTWLHRVTVNAALLLQRRRALIREQRLGVVPADADAEDDAFACDPATAPDHVALQKELRRCLDEAIDRLPPEYRVVYVAAEVEGLANAEISDRLGLSVPAVKSRLHRGRMLLRALLTPYIHGLCD